EALKLLDPSKDTLTNKCPVCELDIDATHVREHLQQWQSELKSDLDPIQREIGELETEERTLKGVVGEFADLDNEIKRKQTPVNEARNAISTSLGRVIVEAEDPLVVVGQEIEQIDRDLKSIHEAVEQSSKPLNAMEDDLDNLGRVLKVLSIKQAIEDLADIKKSIEHEDVVKVRQAGHTFCDRVQVVQEAIQAVLGTVAQAKIDSTKAAISATYRMLAQREDYPDIEIDPEKYEVMAVRQGES